MVRNDAETPLLDDMDDVDPEANDQGYPIDRAEIERILGDSHLDDRVSISSNQQEQLVGKGGLTDWGRGRMSVYDEGNRLIICDEEGQSFCNSHCAWYEDADLQAMFRSARSAKKDRTQRFSCTANLKTMCMYASR